MLRDDDEFDPGIDCPVCHRTFSTYARLDDHLAEHEGPPKVQHVRGANRRILFPINDMAGQYMITAALSYIDSMTATTDNLPASGRQLSLVGASSADQLPAIFLRFESAGRRFWEFFTANIRNRNTRRAYFVAVSQFSNGVVGARFGDRGQAVYNIGVPIGFQRPPATVAPL
jgi:hypothetical protein